MFLLFTGLTCYAQTDTSLAASADTGKQSRNRYADSVAMSRERFVEDSVAMQYIRFPDPARHNVFVDSVIQHLAFNPYNFNVAGVKKQLTRTGTERSQRPQWIMWVLLFLLLYTGFLNVVISKDIHGIVEAFYNKRAFTSLTNEENLLTSWAFIALFSLFGFTIGLYLYHVVTYYQLNYTLSGVQLFLSLSLIVVALFIVKILVLRLLGFVFEIGKLVNEYISVLYLTYFNIAFIFLPVVVMFSLLSSAYKPYLLQFSVFLIIAIFAVQYLRSTINIISKFHFRKIYLFIYLCALEICPVLILIKALEL